MNGPPPEIRAMVIILIKNNENYVISEYFKIISGNGLYNNLLCLLSLD